MLERVLYPTDLKKMTIQELETLAEEIRSRMIQVVSHNGGHLASNLGVVELTLALHRVFESPSDKIIWDVSHQCYPHKILTGRADRFHTLRQWGGISGFCKREESEYDAFNAGHSSTSISAALGMAVGRDMAHRSHHVIAVIGDGSLTGGMAMEALNQAGHLKRNLLIVLNDNEMSIAPNVGAWSGYLKRIIQGQPYTNFSKEVFGLLKGIPGIGDQVLKTTKNIVEVIKTTIVPGQLLEELGLQYIGPVNGHDIKELSRVFTEVKEREGPFIVHVVTRKGKGYPPAERDPGQWHGTSAFDIPSGVSVKSPGPPSYTQVFSEAILAQAQRDNRIVGISAAMLSGTGLEQLKKQFPDRCFDVGIAEQHAVTFAAGMATEGFRPVVAIYSTFLQRAFDQVFHDVCLMNLPVVFALDRAGLVGEDGSTHHGIYDMAYLRLLPNMVIMAPKDEDELCHMLETSIQHNGPSTIRYPRGNGLGVQRAVAPHALPIGKAEVLHPFTEETAVVFLAIGTMVQPAIEAAIRLEQMNIPCAVVNARFVKPLDVELFHQMLPGRWVITLEEGIVAGGFGTAVLETIQQQGITVLGFLRMGLPDGLIPHGDPKILQARYQLDANGIVDQTTQFLKAESWEKHVSTLSSWHAASPKPVNVQKH